MRVLPMAAAVLLLGAAPVASGDRVLAYACLWRGSHASPAQTVAVSLKDGTSTWGVCLRRNKKGLSETYWRKEKKADWSLLSHSMDPNAKPDDPVKVGVPSRFVGPLRDGLARARAHAVFPV